MLYRSKDCSKKVDALETLTEEVKFIGGGFGMVTRRCEETYLRSFCSGIKSVLCHYVNSITGD